MLKVTDVYEKVLKEVTCNLRKVLNESVKSIKKVPKTPTSRKPAPCRNQSSNPTGCNKTDWLQHKLTGCNKTQAQNQRRPQNRPEYQKYLQFHNIN